MKWIILVGIIGLVFLVGCVEKVVTAPTECYDNCNAFKGCVDCPEEDQAMVLNYPDSWGENIEDESEILFGNYIYNFGDIEAKNVILECNISNTNEDIEFSERKNIGNIASNSYTYKELSFKYSIRDEYSVGGCRVVDCDNCILLLDKIKSE